MGARLEEVDGMHAGQSKGVWSHVGRCRSIFQLPGDTLMTLNHTHDQMRRSGYD